MPLKVERLDTNYRRAAGTHAHIFYSASCLTGEYGEWEPVQRGGKHDHR